VYRPLYEVPSPAVGSTLNLDDSPVVDRRSRCCVRRSFESGFPSTASRKRGAIRAINPAESTVESPTPEAIEDLLLFGRSFREESGI
jgi:hypothetical protein